MEITIEFEQEDDGRWIAEVPDIPGVMAYGDTREIAAMRAEALALRCIAERLEKCDPAFNPFTFSVSFCEPVAIN